MSYELPEADGSVIDGAREDYQRLQGAGSSADFQDATFRLAWSLAHSEKTSDVALGLNMAEELLRGALDDPGRREAMYYVAVCYFKLGRYVDARKQIHAIVEEWPECRQAHQLKGLVDDKIIREGLIGVAVAGAAVVGAGVLAVATALLRK